MIAPNTVTGDGPMLEGQVRAGPWLGRLCYASS